MKKRCLFNLLIICIFFGLDSLNAQVSGDIVFTGYGSESGEDGFSFIATTSISAGTTLHFTDNGWLSSGTFRTGEGFLSYTVPAGGLSLADQVDINVESGTWTASDGGSVTEKGNLDIATSGDQLFAFTGTVTSSTVFTVTTVLAGIDFYNVGASRGVFDANATGSQSTALPPALTLDTNAVAIDVGSTTDDNGRLAFEASFLSGNKASIQFYACTSSNWETDGEVVYNLPPPAQNRWNGTAWSTGSAPGAAEYAVISANQSFTVSTNLSVSEVAVEAGATLTIGAAAQLTIATDITNNGTVDGTGTLKFDNSGNSCRIRGQVDFEGVVEVASGTTLKPFGNLTLTASDKDEYGQLIGLGTVDGDVNVQAWLDLAGGGSDGRYYQIGSPVTTTDFNDINEGGILNVANASNGTVWQWDASTATWAAPGAATDNLEQGRGYAVYAGSHNGNDFVRADAGTIELTGSVTTANVTVSLAYNNGQSSPGVNFLGDDTDQTLTEGWNLLSNPYPSQYDWDGQTRPAGLNDAIYSFNGSGAPGSESYATYISSVSANGGDRYIAPYQGFWVQTTSASPGNLTFSSAQRAAIQPSAQLFKTTVVDGVYLRVHSRQHKDEIFMGFDANATSDFDGDYDAWKFANGDSVPSIYSKTNGKTLAINRIGLQGNNAQFDVGVHYSKQGAPLSISLKDDELKSFDAVFLKDLKSNVLHNFKDGACSYTHDTTFSELRFQLIFNKQNVSLQEINGQSEKYCYTDEGQLIVAGLHSGKDSYIKVYSANGQLVHQQKTDTKKVNLKFDHQPGVYLINISDGTELVTLKTQL